MACSGPALLGRTRSGGAAARIVLAAAALAVSSPLSAQLIGPQSGSGVDLGGVPTDPAPFVERFGLSAEDFLPGTPVDPETLGEIAREADEIQRRARQDIARGWAAGRDGHDPAVASPAGDAGGSDYRVTVLVSMSLGEELLADYFARHSHPPSPGRPPVRFVFRGLIEGETLAGAAMRLAEMSGARLPLELGDAVDDLRAPRASPVVLMDPRLFAAADRPFVPALIVERAPATPETVEDRSWGGRSHQEAVEAAVTGAIEDVRSDALPPEPVAVFYGTEITPEEAVRRVEAGARGDQGVFGEVREILEEDLRVHARRMAEARLAAVDADPGRIGREYFARLGSEAAALGLTPAVEETIERLSFAQRLNRDIVGPDGVVIARAGQIFDPATVVAWDRRMFVFDPLVPEEVEFVAGWGGYLGPGVVRNLYLVTRLPETGAVELIEGLVDRLDAPVFVLNAQVARAFRLRHTLTVIEPDGSGGVFRRELPLALARASRAAAGGEGR